MRFSVEHERLVRMIKESISLMCKSSLSYDLELNVEGLLGITLDKKDIFLVNINESFQTDALKLKEQEEQQRRQASEARSQKRSQSDNVEIKQEEDADRQPSSAKKRRRRRSRDSQGTGDSEGVLSPSQESPSQRPVGSQHTDTSRDNTRSSEDVPVKEESGELDFGDFVIKQEVGDVETIDDDDDDLMFTGESFEGHPPYAGSMALAGPSGGGFGQGPPGASMSMEGDGSQPGLASGHPSEMGILPSWINFPGSAPFRCHFCSKAFQTKSGKLEHERFHTGMTVSCSLCGKGFPSRSKLKRHKEATHDQIKHTCDSCHKDFSYLSALQRHQRVSSCGGLQPLQPQPLQPHQPLAASATER